MEERRKHKRLQMKERSSLARNNAREECLLLDISPGGMRVQLEKEIKPGDTVSGQFRILPNAGPFYIQGVVSWVKPLKDKDANYEIGVKFTKINTIPF